MKVLHICSYYLGTRLYEKLIEKLEENNTDNTVYVPATKYDVPQFELKSNVLVSRCLNKYDRVAFFYKHGKIFKDLNQAVKVGDYDVLHAHSLFSNGYIAYKLKQQYKIPYVVAVRNTDVNVFFKRMVHLRGLGVKILRNADKIIFLSSSYVNFVLDTYIPAEYRDEIKKKISVIPNGIDDFWLKDKGTPKELPDSKKIRLVFAGSIDKNKNITTTAKACEELKKRGYEVMLAVAGGIKDDEIYQQLKSFDFINYVGKMNQEQLRALYQETDIFIMNSIHETFGLVYAEAMSQGLPVVYTKGQGFDGQFAEGLAGYAVDCFDVSAIADTVEKIVGNYSSISKNCIELSDKFDWGNIAKAYLGIYQAIT